MYFSSLDNPNSNAVSIEEVLQTPLAEIKTQIEAEKVMNPSVNKEQQTTQGSKRELPKSSGLGSMFKDINKHIVVVEKKQKVELTADNVEELWKNFLAEGKQHLQPAFLNVAQTQKPVLVNDKIQFTLTNNISLEILQLHKLDITSYYRNHTSNNTVVPEFILLRDPNATKQYKTNKDRLKDMIDKNPVVLKLLEKFDLNEY